MKEMAKIELSFFFFKHGVERKIDLVVRGATILKSPYLKFLRFRS